MVSWLGTCEKERILNHLEGLNLLPSLEDILKDYFAYQGPDEVANDKVYMLWKQVDVVIGQLRAITMGKSKAKAFMNSRRAPRTFNKLVSKNENICQPDTNQFTGNEAASFCRQATGLQNTQKVHENQMEKLNTFMLEEDSCVKSTQTAVLTTPIKDTVKKGDKKEFRSPRRKPRHPRHVTTSTEELVKCSTCEVVSDAPLNREFSDLVAALISNDKLSVKLADNINKVVSVETKPPSNDDDIDEIIKLTAGDPDLNFLFSMLGGPLPHSTQDASEPVDQHFDMNTVIASAGLNMETTTLSNYIELQPIVTSASNSQIEVVNSNLQPSFTCMESVDKLNITQTGDANLQPFLMQDPTITNFLEILNPYTSSYPCMRDLNDEFSDYTNKMETSYEPLHLPEPPKSLQESNSLPKTVEKTLVTSQIDDKVYQPNGSLITSPQLQSSSTCTKLPCGEVVNVDNNNIGHNTTEKKNVDDNVILASHALLQLSTSPMKLSTTSTVENVISKPIVSPQALASNRKMSRELICSTHYTVQENPPDINDIASEIVTQSNQIENSQNIYLLSDPNRSNKTCGTQPNNIASNVIGLKDGRKHTRKKCAKIKKSNTDIEDKILISQCENEDTINKKPKRGKEIMVTQLDFNPAIPSTPINRLNKVDNDNGINNNNNTIFEGSGVPFSKSSVVDINISPKIPVTDHCDILSPAFMLHAQLKSLSSKNDQTIGENMEMKCMHSSSSNPEIKATSEEGIYSKCSVVKPTTDQFQTFRITGNAISKVVSLDHNNVSKTSEDICDATFSCKSKIRAISMVINNTNSLNKITDANMLPMNNISKGATIPTNKLGVTYDPPGHKCSTDNMNSPPLTPKDSSSYLNIRKNCFMPSILPGEKGTNDYLDLGASSNSTSREKEKASVTSKVVSNIPIGKCDHSNAKSDTECFGNNIFKKEDGNDTTITNAVTVDPLHNVSSDNIENNLIKKEDGNGITTNAVTVDPLQNTSNDDIIPQLCVKREDYDGCLQVVGKHSSEKREKNNSTPACGSSKISKKRGEKSYPTRSKYTSKNKMTVKFNFRKSPTRKKHFISEVENTNSEIENAEIINRELVEGTHSCETSSDIYELVSQKEDGESCKDNVDLVMSKIEPLSYPVTTTVFNQETVCKQSFLECLKTSCNIAVTSSNTYCNNKFVGGERNATTNIDTTGTCTPDTTTIDFSIIDTTTNESTSMDITRTDIPTPNIPIMDILTTDIPASEIPTTDISTTHILTSDKPTSAIATSDVPPNDIPICDSTTTHPLLVPSSLSQPVQITSENNNIVNVGMQPTGKITKRKAKRKRNLSLLMLNVDNVAQLLSGIDYS